MKSLAKQGRGKGKEKLEQDRQDTQKNKGDWSGVNQSPCFPYCYRETSMSTRGGFLRGRAHSGTRQIQSGQKT